MMVKEVCVIKYIRNSANYGVGSYLKEYLYCLNNLGHRINIIELGGYNVDASDCIREVDNVRTISFPLSFPGDFEKYIKGVSRALTLYIEDSNNLVFHIQHVPPNNLLDCLKKYFPQSKSVITIHDFSWITILQGNISLFDKIIRNQEREKFKIKYNPIIEMFKKEKAFLEKFDRVVCLSEDALHLINNLYGIKQNACLIPNGLKRDCRNLSQKRKMSLREKYRLSPEEKVLLFVGRIESHKGIEPLIACFDEVVNVYPDCRLVMVGDGQISEVIKQCKRLHAKVILTGRLDKKTLYQWYQMADIALLPSYMEECSYVGIEMLMHGLPIIASDGFGVKNMFQEGVNAKVAKIENYKSIKKFQRNLKEAILCLLNADLSTLEIRKGALKTYQSKYSIECLQNGYTVLFNSL